MAPSATASRAHLVNFYGRQGFELESIKNAPRFLTERLTQYRAKGIEAILMRRPADTHLGSGKFLM